MRVDFCVRKSKIRDYCYNFMFFRLPNNQTEFKYKSGIIFIIEFYNPND
jgi:hypothetical protein